MRRLLSLFVLLGLGACEPKLGGEIRNPGVVPPVASEPLDGTGWVLSAIRGEPVSRAATGTSISFTDTGASGDGPCNRYGSEIESDPDRSTIRFGPVVATERACFPQTRMIAENAYFATLPTISGFRREADDLVLLDATGAEALRYEMRPATGEVETDLIGTQWSLGDLEGSAAFGLASISFEANGELTGQGPCNTYAGDYRLGAGRTIVITARTTTRCACPELAREQQYLAALRRALTWRIEGERLLLEAREETILIMERLRESPLPLRGC